MKREEEIQIRAEQEYNWFGDTGDVKGAFISGAKWADQHPRKGLVDIEKVIEYMKKNSRFNYLLETDYEVLEDLRKAMED